MSEEEMKMSRGIVIFVLGIVLAGCAAVESEVPAAPPAPLSALLPPQQATLPGSGIQLRWQMPQDRRDDGQGWTLTCMNAKGVGAGSARSNPPLGPVETCGFGQLNGFFYGGVVFQPNVALVEMTFDDHSVIRQAPTGRFFGVQVDARINLSKIDLIMPDGTGIPAQP